MDKDFARAFLPRKWQVLQLELLPFTVGHSIILCALSNPYGECGEALVEATTLDLAAACMVCSLPYDDAVELVSDTAAWTRELNRLEIAVGETDFAQANNLFLEYISENSKIPDFKCEGEFREAFGPWQGRLIASLMSELHMSEYEALNMPLARAWWYHLSRQEAQGSIGICTDEEKELVDSLTEPRWQSS